MAWMNTYVYFMCMDTIFLRTKGNYVYDAFIYGMSSILYNTKLQKTMIFTLFETSLKFTHAFCLSNTHFHKTGPLKLIETVLYLFSRLGRFTSTMQWFTKG